MENNEKEKDVQLEILKNLEEINLMLKEQKEQKKSISKFAKYWYRFVIFLVALTCSFVIAFSLIGMLSS